MSVKSARVMRVSRLVRDSQAGQAFVTLVPAPDQGGARPGELVLYEVQLVVHGTPIPKLDDLFWVTVNEAT